MYEVYTPGHGLVTDSLIMHGIVRLYNVEEVERVGDRYRIVGDFSKVRKDALSLLREELNIYFKNEDAISNSSILGKIKDANVNVAFTHKWMSYLRDALDRTNFGNLVSIFTPDHKDRAKEGRSKSESLYTLYLPLSHIHGKYSQYNYTLKNRQYMVCGACFSLANIGLIYGTAVIKKETKTNTNMSVTLLSIIPGAKMSKTDLLLAQRFVRGKFVDLRTELTVKATLLYALSIGETLFSFGKEDCKPQVLIWRLENVGGSQRSIQPMTFELGDLLKKIGKIKAEYPMFTKLVMELALTDEGALILDGLAEAIMFGYDEYHVLKEIVSLAQERDRDREKPKLSRGVIEGLSDLAKALISVRGY